MTDPSYYTEVTAAGEMLLAAALANKQAVSFAFVAVGTGDNNASYPPSKTQTALKAEVWRGPVMSVSTDPANPNWILVAAEIPTDQGGYTVREAGVFTADGSLIAVANVPESYKPMPTSGAAFPLPVELMLQVTSAAAVSLVVSSSSYATRDYADGLVPAHVALADPHPQYLTPARADSRYAPMQNPMATQEAEDLRALSILAYLNN